MNCHQKVQCPSVPGGVVGVGVLFAWISALVPWQGDRAAFEEILLLDPFIQNVRPLHTTHFPRQHELDLLVLPQKELLDPALALDVTPSLPLF